MMVFNKSFIFCSSLYIVIPLKQKLLQHITFSPLKKKKKLKGRYVTGGLDEEKMNTRKNMFSGVNKQNPGSYQCRILCANTLQKKMGPKTA